MLWLAQVKTNRSKEASWGVDTMIQGACVLIRSSLIPKGEAESRAEASPPRSLGPSDCTDRSLDRGDMSRSSASEHGVCQHSIRPWPPPHFCSQGAALALVRV